MARYALFSDIHANLPALQVVLIDIGRQHAGQRHGERGRYFAQWMPRWMLAACLALSRTATLPQIWRPDGENMAAAGIEPATQGL